MPAPRPTKNRQFKHKYKQTCMDLLLAQLIVGQVDQKLADMYIM